MMEADRYKNILPNKFDYLIVENVSFESAEKFSCTLRAKILNDEEFFEWLQQFEELTNTNWILKNSKAESKKFRFSRDYACHHSSLRKKALGDDNVRNKNKSCGAKLSVRIKWNSKDVRYRDKYVKEGFTGIITISFIHSHAINTAESWHWLKRAPEIPEKFLDYFNRGLTPAAAMLYHEDEILKDYNAEGVANSRVNPPKRWVYKLHSKWLLENYGGQNNDDCFLAIAKNKANELRKNGHKILIEEDPLSIVIITPLMERALNSIETSSFFIDTSASCDRTNTALTVVLVATKAGAVPVGCALHESQTEENFLKVFNMMLKVWPQDVQDKITNFVTDNCGALKNALKCIFPNVRQLLCLFHVLQALWRWLSSTKHTILQIHRLPLMNLFKSVLYAQNVNEMVAKKNLLLSNQICMLYPNFIAHLYNLFANQHEICVALRADVCNNQHNTNNYAEATFRIVKDIILNRVKAYNSVALMEFLTTTLDSYFSKKILDIIFGRNNRPFLLHEKIAGKAKVFIDNDLVFEKDGFYVVRSEKEESIFYEVDTGFCSCAAAAQGAFCKHQCAVQIKFNKQFPNAPRLFAGDKKKLFFIAVGESRTCPDSFFEGMVGQDNILDEACTRHKNEVTPATNEVNMDFHLDENESGVNPPLDKDAILQNFKAEYERLGHLLSSNKNDNLFKLADRYVRKMKNVSTSGQFHSFLSSSLLNFRCTFGRKIKIQPTSLARRRRTGGRVGRPCKKK